MMNTPLTQKERVLAHMIRMAGNSLCVCDKHLGEIEERYGSSQAPQGLLANAYGTKVIKSENTCFICMVNQHT